MDSDGAHHLSLASKQNGNPYIDTNTVHMYMYIHVYTYKYVIH